MSYTVQLIENGKVANLNCQVAGTGSQFDMLHPFEAEISIPFNCNKIYNSVLTNGIVGLYDKKANDCIPELSAAILMLSDTNPSPDIWENCNNNAAYFLNILLNWAIEKPEAKFKVLY